MLTRIHVNQHNIKHNDAVGGVLPVLTVKDYKQNRKGQTAKITYFDRKLQRTIEVARVVYRPWDPLPCGAKCWIETNCDVTVE